MLDRSKGGANIVTGKFEEFLAGVNEGIEDALSNTLSVIIGPSASVSDTVCDAGSRGCEGRLFLRATFPRAWRGPTLLL